MNVTAQLGIAQGAMFYKTKITPPLTQERRIEYENAIKGDYIELKECETDRCKIGLYFRMSSLYYMIDSPKDTIEVCINKAFALDSVRTCEMLHFFDKSKKPNLPQWMIELEPEYFAKEFNKEWWAKAVKVCQPIWDKIPIKKKVIEKDTLFTHPVYRIALVAMEKKDQEHRRVLSDKPDNEELWKIQRKNDLENRQKLDSLFALYGFPTKEKVGKDGASATWLIIQHSTDCDWNKVWIERYIDIYANGIVSSTEFYPNTIDRFFHPKNGYCPVEDRKAFIQHLQQTYSEEIAEQFGFKDFYKE